MKAVKVIGVILGAIVGLLVLGVFGAWFAFVRAPSPEDQCAHLVELAKKETGGIALGDQFTKDCEKKAKQGEYEGLIPYAERSKCLMDADSITAADKCGKTRRN